MSAQARDAVVSAIRDHGPISFAEYMEVALYGPGGYFERPPIGEAGDFVTAPHVHPIFGALLARGIRDLWEALGRPAPLQLVEVGAGDGTLARQLIEALTDAGVDVAYTAVERTAGAREALAAVEGATVAEHLPEDAHVILAHELLDNMPFRRVRVDENVPVEVRVGMDVGGHLVEVPTDAGADPDALAVLTGLGSGQESVIPDGALAFVDGVAAALSGGYALLIDYGALGSPGGTAHGYRRHRAVDLALDDPGTTDITAGVDFARIARRAEEDGLVAFPTASQLEALSALGFQDWVRSELSRQHRLLDARDPDAVRAWSSRSRATLLVDPSALGRFRWLLLATPGLPAPRWLEGA